jgi:hypothetical protein
MAITFVNASQTSGNGVTSLSLSVPTGVASGDFIAFVAVAYSATVTWPSGVTSLANGTGNNTNHNYDVAYKIAGASESTYTVSFSTTTWCAAMAYALHGTASGAPTLYSNVNTSGTYPTSLPAASGSIGASTDATLYVFAGENSGDSGTETLTFPGSLSNTHQINETSAGDVIGMGWGIDVTSPGSATVSTAVDYYDFLFDIAAAAAAGGAVRPRPVNRARFRAACW